MNRKELVAMMASVIFSARIAGNPAFETPQWALDAAIRDAQAILDDLDAREYISPRRTQPPKRPG